MQPLVRTPRRCLPPSLPAGCGRWWWRRAAGGTAAGVRRGAWRVPAVRCVRCGGRGGARAVPHGGRHDALWRRQVRGRTVHVAVPRRCRAVPSPCCAVLPSPAARPRPFAVQVALTTLAPLTGSWLRACCSGPRRPPVSASRLACTPWGAPPRRWGRPRRRGSRTASSRRVGTRTSGSSEPHARPLAALRHAPVAAPCTDGTCRPPPGTNNLSPRTAARRRSRCRPRRSGRWSLHWSRCAPPRTLIRRICCRAARAAVQPTRLSGRGCGDPRARGFWIGHAPPPRARARILCARAFQVERAGAELALAAAPTPRACCRAMCACRAGAPLRCAP